MRVGGNHEQVTLTGKAFDQLERDPIVRSLQSFWELPQIAHLSAVNFGNGKRNLAIPAARLPLSAGKADLCASLDVVDVDLVLRARLCD